MPPDYEGEIPSGYIVKKSKTYGHWLAMRGFMKNFEPAPVVKNMKDHFRLYHLGSAPKKVNWVNVAMEDFNTLHALDVELSALIENERRSTLLDESPPMLSSHFFLHSKAVRSGLRQCASRMRSNGQTADFLPNADGLFFSRSFYLYS